MMLSIISQVSVLLRAFGMSARQLVRNGALLFRATGDTASPPKLRRSHRLSGLLLRQ